MIYGYARVSTKGQDRYGNSLEAQEKLLREAGAEKILCESFTGFSCSFFASPRYINTVMKGACPFVVRSVTT